MMAFLSEDLARPFKSGVNGIRTLDQCIERPDI